MVGQAYKPWQAFFFLQLVADSVEDVNRQLDFDNMSYARKMMIHLEMALAFDGT